MTFVICLGNSGYEVSLEPLKVYQALPDAHAKRLRQVRVVDESGEDYLFPKSLFAEIKLTPRVRRVVLSLTRRRKSA